MNTDVLELQQTTFSSEIVKMFLFKNKISTGTCFPESSHVKCTMIYLDYSATSCPKIMVLR